MNRTTRQRLALVLLGALVAWFVIALVSAAHDCDGWLVMRAWPPGWACIP